LHIGEEKSIHLYRVIQETVHNCIKHARASKLEIIIEQKGNVIQILCRDNGKGFNYDQVTKDATGIGLRSLKNRTELMGGKMYVESKPMKGTAFLFEIPVK
jgi:signal transduction histidine kinase